MKKLLFVFAHDERESIIKAKCERIIDGIKKANYQVEILSAQKGSIWYKRIFDLCLLQLKYLRLITKRHYDLIFIRYSYEYLFLFLTNIIFNLKCHIEINAKIAEQFVCQRQYIRGRISKVSLFLATRCCKRVHAVTPEIKRYYEKSFTKSECVYSPNFVVDEYFIKNNTIRNRPIKLVFMGNTSQKWHGIDKFINKVVINNQWFNNNCELHIIGETDKKFRKILEINKLHSKVIIHGFLEGQKKKDVMSRMDIGIDKMNTNLVNAIQATSIKTGEYLYSGLPVIIGHNDPRLNEELNFVLRINIDDEIKKLQSIVNEFIKFVIKSPDINIRAHKYAKRNMIVDRYIENILRG